MSTFELLGERIGEETKGILGLIDYCKLKYGESRPLSAEDRNKIQHAIAILEKAEVAILQARKKTGMKGVPDHFQKKLQAYLEAIWTTQGFLCARCDENRTVQ